MATYPKINISKYNRDVFLPVASIQIFGWTCDDQKVFTISEDQENLFRIIEDKLYIVKYPTLGNHDIIIKMADIFDRYDPIERSFTFNVSLCENCSTEYICVEVQEGGGGDDDDDDDDTGTDAGFSITQTIGTVERVLAGHDMGSKLRPLDPEVVNDENISQSIVTAVPLQADQGGGGNGVPNPNPPMLYTMNSAESYLRLNDLSCIASGVDDKFIRDITFRITQPNQNTESFDTNFSSSCPLSSRTGFSDRIDLNDLGNAVHNQDFKSIHQGELYNLKIGSGLYQQAPTSRMFGEVSLEYELDIARAIYDLNAFVNDEYLESFSKIIS